MKMKLVSISSFLFFIIFYKCSADYWSDRDAVLAKEASQLLGSTLTLSEKEQKVNDILMALKLKEYDEGFADPSKFLPSKHFFTVKSDIENSEVFKFIQKVPKGALLHSHSSSMVSFEFLFNLTYRENLYGCNDTGNFKLHFFFNSTDLQCEWKLLSDWRKENSQFDDFLKTQMSLVVDDPERFYTDINVVWKKFEDIFTFISPLLEYKPVLHDYIYQALQEFSDDNVIYMEIRSDLENTFDENGTNDIHDTMQLYTNTQLEFREKNNIDFGGLRIIYAKSRRADNKTMEEYIDQLLELQNIYSDLIAGFDLTGQEDLGPPLSDFADQLIAVANKTSFFFHAGETDWLGTRVDENLIDAILLNTTRIGHGFAVTKHPEVLKLIKDRQIAVELNPISNQVLKLVDDVRNHPGAKLIAEGYPVVVSCDDPSFWGAKGLSYDWYMAFMGMTPRSGDLRVLKQLAYNSLTYSSLSPNIKPYAFMIFEGRWDTFLNNVLAEHNVN